MRTREDIEKRLGGQDPSFIEAEIIRLLLDIRDLLNDLRHVHGTANGPIKITHPT